MKKQLNILLISLSMFLSLTPLNVFCCTSWMIFDDISGSGTNILHKNRDAHPRNIAVYLSPANAPRKWIGMGNNGGSYMGMNASGLAVIMNNGEPYANYRENTGKNKKVPDIILDCLEQCDTARQAVEYLQNVIIKKNLYSHAGKKGSIYFFCDRNEGYVCELTGSFCSVQHYSQGYTVRANIWQAPGMYQRSRNTIKAHLNSSARAYIAISELNRALDKNGKIHLADIFALSRHYLMPQESPQKRSVCFNATNSTSTFEIDKQYPDVLSSAYLTIGHPRHTVYVPIPVCATELHPAMKNLEWSNAAWARFNEKKLAAPFPAEWTEFEQNAIAVYNRAKTEARKLLAANKRAEAVKLMNSTAGKIWNDAAKLLEIR